MKGRNWWYALFLLYSISHYAFGEYSTSINSYEPFYQMFFVITDYKASLSNLRNTLLIIVVLVIISIYIAIFLCHQSVITLNKMDSL
ncbi:hypothetical protein PMU86_17750 [Enterococcus casseliflavus]|nr:hypothetical protein [Enterococcus casseliflavus]